jgi:dienelactone hydrolase
MMAYVERTNYWAKEGLTAEVLSIRREASQIRLRLGLPAGTIFVRQNAEGEGPDVAWVCSFPTHEAHERDLAARAASPEFQAIRRRMSAATSHFERHLMQSDAPITRLHDVDLRGVAIAPREVRFVSGEHELAGYLFLPPGDGPFPCMVVNHGSGVDQGSWDICRPATAATLMSWGVASFMPHRRGYGNSPGRGWRVDVPAEFGTPEYDSQLVARLDAESADVVAALRYLQGLSEIDAEHIGVMGSSFGGINTLLAVAQAPDFRCAVEFAGAAMNWERTANLREFLAGVARRVSRPIFFIQAANDFSIGPTQVLSDEARKSGCPVESKIYPAWGVTPTEGHLFAGNAMLLWSADVRPFLERWL